MGIYESLAPVYDGINDELDYEAWADAICKWLSAYGGKQGDVILDLGCGTGSMTIPMAQRGYDMIGLDLSADMLTLARDREERGGVPHILWTLQDMTDFSLYGMVDGVISCLDSINHLESKDALRKCFANVYEYLRPGGAFIFDVNSQFKFENLYGDQTYVYENENSFCVWQNEYNRRSKKCTFYITMFTECTDGTHRYDREDSVQIERYYSISELKEELERAGFEVIGVYGGFDESPVSKQDDRWYIVARKRK